MLATVRSTQATCECNGRTESIRLCALLSLLGDFQGQIEKTLSAVSIRLQHHATMWVQTQYTARLKVCLHFEWNHTDGVHLNIFLIYLIIQVTVKPSVKFKGDVSKVFLNLYMLQYYPLSAKRNP